MRNMILVFMLLFSSVAMPEDMPSIDNIYDTTLEAQNYHDNLYINKLDPNLMATISTMTYYVSSEMRPNEYMLESFKYFADNLGLKNGAVFIALDEYKSYINHEPNLAYIKQSFCDKKMFSRDVIIIENRRHQKCIEFPLTDAAPLQAIFATIDEKIKNPNDLQYEANIISLRKAVEKNFERYEIPKENMEILDIIVNYLKTLFSS